MTRTSRVLLLALSSLVTACVSRPVVPPPVTVAAPASSSLSDRIRATMQVLSSDSLSGRSTGTPGAAMAARFLASAMQSAGVQPAGDSGYFQRVPIAYVTRADGRIRPILVTTPAVADSIPAERRGTELNVIGMVRGSDPVLRDEVVLLTAHYDHVGIGAPVDGDSIYNGADDNASGTTTVLEIARALAGAKLRRTVVFALMSGEEVGLIGTRWYIQHPIFPLEKTVANLNFEMVGRPDTSVGGAGRLWLTGFERSTMGAMFAAAGLAIAPDARPSFRFFERSDNIVFARLGIPAHTLSSYNMHADYHKPSDEMQGIDVGHMATLIENAVRAVRVLADGERPTWNPGGQPPPSAR